MCVFCVFFPFILDIKFVGRTSRGHTGGRSHRIFHPPSLLSCYYTTVYPDKVSQNGRCNVSRHEVCFQLLQTFHFPNCGNGRAKVRGRVARSFPNFARASYPLRRHFRKCSKVWKNGRFCYLVLVKFSNHGRMESAGWYRTVQYSTVSRKKIRRYYVLLLVCTVPIAMSGHRLEEKQD